MDIDYTPLEKAINQLEISLRYANSEMAQQDSGLFEQLRNSVIQCFEFTYELSHKMLRRYIEEGAASTATLDIQSFQNLIRAGNEQNLLRSDWRKWKAYRQARNESSHTYDLDKAEQVYLIVPDFLLEAKYLYQELTK